MRYALTGTIFLSALLALESCTKTETQSTTDSLTTEQIDSLNPDINGLPPVSINQISTDSFATTAPQSGASDISGNDRLQAVQFRYIGKTQTAIPRVMLYVVGVDALDTSLTLHALIMNGKVVDNSDLNPRIIRLTKEQVNGIKILDNTSGRSYSVVRSEIPEEISSRGMSINPGDTRDIVLTFPGMPASTQSVTLIIPGFATLPSMPIRS